MYGIKEVFVLLAILYILFLGLMGTAKVTVQGKFGKKNVSTLSDAIFFNGLIFLFSALVFMKDAGSAPLPVILYGMAFGFWTMIFQMTYIKALSVGNVSITVLLVNFAVIFPILVSALVFHEPIGFLQYIAMALIAISFIISTDFTKREKSTVKWLIPAIFAVLSNGMNNVVQKLFATRYTDPKFTTSYVAWGYIFATVFSVILYVIFACTGRKKTFPNKWNMIGYSAATGIILGVFQFFNTQGAARIPGTIFFPTYAGAAIILSALSGVVLFRDKLTKKQICGIACGTAALVLMNL